MGVDDPTGPVPAAGGPPPPPAGPPADPFGPSGAEPPEPSDSGPDWRIVVIATLTSLIVLLVLVLLLVREGGDDGDDVVAADRSTTTTSSTTTTTSTSSSTTTTTTTTTTSTTAPTPSTPTSSTSRPAPTLAPSTTTIPRERCTGRTGPDQPGPVAQVFYDAWTVDDRSCAGEVATNEAIEDLFVFDGSQADWTFEGCDPEGADPDSGTECFFRYEGGSATFAMTWDVVDGWTVTAVTFTVD